MAVGRCSHVPDVCLIRCSGRVITRGFVTDGCINDRGLAFRQMIEDKTNTLSEKVWRHLGEPLTLDFVELVEPVGQKFLARIDVTACEKLDACRTRLATNVALLM